MIISSNNIMCHVHPHPPSHHIGKILDGQSFITGKRVLVVHNTHRKQKNLQARSPCSVQDAVLSQNCKAQSFRHGFLSQVAPIWYGVTGCRCDLLTVSECGRPPSLAGAPWLRIWDSVCLPTVIGPVLLFVKMCFLSYETVFKSPRRPNFDREGRCNK